MEEVFKKIKGLLIGGVLLFVVFGILPATAQAASLYFSPSTGSYAVGSPITLNVYVSSADQAMNAASGVISFPNNKLEVTSLSKTGSIFTLWVQEPSFSNSVGMVNFEGIVLNPGFTGSGGKVLSITFKTKAAGNAPLTFSSGSALANDGKGTNILTGLGDANFSIGVVRPGAPEIVTPAEIAGTPTAPEISSPTHPDPNKWYAVKEAKFTWDVSKDVTAVRLLVGRIPQAIPTVTYTTPVNSKEITDLADGSWYFHVRLRNAEGWGGVSHFRFQIDTEKPTRFEISEVQRKDPTDPKAKFIFDAKDDTSGIDHYEIQINNKSPQIWQDDGGHIYETNALPPGKHTLIAKAIDKAGNASANSAEFSVEALEPPIITEWPRELQSGEPLTIKGTTKYPNIQVVVWLQRENDDAKSQITKSDGKGNFVFVADEKLSDGAYKIWAKVVDERGAQSKPSNTVTIAVGKPAFLKLGSWAVSLLAVIVPLVALIFILLFIIWYGWHKFGSFRKKLKNLRKEVREAESALHKAFDMLKEDIRDQVKLLEKTRTKRQLTEEEEKIIKQLRKDLDDAEKFVRKEIEDIEEAVK
ncbi:MAG: hypothetical protein WAP51_00715 [Candidatus Sungiibacteriota bacterium]